MSVTNFRRFTNVLVPPPRSLELVYQRSGNMKGIPLFRFVAPKTLFANGTDYAPNEGFCPCRQSGLLNVSSCRQGESAFIRVNLCWFLFACLSAAASSSTSLLSRLSGLHLPPSLFQRRPGSTGLRAGTLSKRRRAWPLHRYSPSECTHARTHGRTHPRTPCSYSHKTANQWHQQSYSENVNHLDDVDSCFNQNYKHCEGLALRHYATCVNLVITAICCALSCDKVIGSYLSN